jgi:hypothetical protein
MAPLTIYSVDSSALIHGWRRIYRLKNFGFVWERLGVLIEEDRLRASIEVYNDLEKKDDELFKWCKERKEKLVVEIDDNIQSHVARIIAAHPRLVDTVKGRSGFGPVRHRACRQRESDHDRCHGRICGEGPNPRCV